MNKTTEELSIALDQLNTGQAPQSTDDKELKELLEVAALLRESDLPVRPPEHLLTASVKRAMEGLAASPDLQVVEDLPVIEKSESFSVSKNNRRRFWMYSGVLGAAAALMVFVGIHGFPEIQDVAKEVSSTAVRTSVPEAAPAAGSLKLSPQPPAIAESPAPSAPVAPSPANPGATSPATPPAPTTTPAPAAPAAPATPEVPPAARSAAPPAEPSPSTLPPSPSLVPPPAARSAGPSIAEKSMPRHSPAAGLASKSVPYSEPVDKPVSPTTLVPLRLPGRTADSVTRDFSAGVIRQIFGKDTAQELIITQRIPPTSEKGAAARTEPQAVPEMAKKDSLATIPLTKIVIVVHGQEVTLEGRQTTEELTKLAQSLTLR